VKAGKSNQKNYQKVSKETLSMMKTSEIFERRGWQIREF